MKSTLVASLAVLTLVLTGCGASTGDGETTSPSASVSASPSDTSTDQLALTAWASNIGLIEAITTVTSGLSTDLMNLTSTDVATVSKAFASRGSELAAAAKAIAGEPTTTNAAYEQLHTAMVDALNGYADSAAALASATAANRQGLVLAATTSLASLTGAIQALVDYIAAHGAEAIQPKS